MTAPSATHASLGDENDMPDLTDVLDAVVAQLLRPGMSRTQVLTALMTDTTATNANGSNPIAEAAGTLLANAERDEMINRFVGIIVMLERGLPVHGTRITILHARLLHEASELCLQITDPYWRCIALSLRAECLLLLALNAKSASQAEELNTQAVDAARASLLAAPPGDDLPHPMLEDRGAYNRDVINGKTPPVTTMLFLGKLQDDLVLTSKAEAHGGHKEESALITA